MIVVRKSSVDLGEAVASACVYASFRGYEQAHTGHFLLAVLERSPHGVEATVLRSVGLRDVKCKEIWDAEKVGSNVNPNEPAGIAPDLRRALEMAEMIAYEHKRSDKVALDVLLAIVRDPRDCEAHKAFRRTHIQRSYLAEALERAYYTGAPANS